MDSYGGGEWCSHDKMEEEPMGLEQHQTFPDAFFFFSLQNCLRVYLESSLLLTDKCSGTASMAARLQKKMLLAQAIDNNKLAIEVFFFTPIFSSVSWGIQDYKTQVALGSEEWTWRVDLMMHDTDLLLACCPLPLAKIMFFGANNIVGYFMWILNLWILLWIPVSCPILFVCPGWQQKVIPYMEYFCRTSRWSTIIAVMHVYIWLWLSKDIKGALPRFHHNGV